MSPKPPWLYRQSAVIPYRLAGDGIEVLLITSARSGRWIIPKGVVEPDLTPVQSALKEAWEEAGVSGRVEPTAIGSYRYDKWGGTCTVTVFLLEVTTVATVWPESRLRRRRWFPITAAGDLVDQPGLRDLIRSLGARLGPGAG